jgi:hypothetical protein
VTKCFNLLQITVRFLLLYKQAAIVITTHNCHPGLNTISRET